MSITIETIRKRVCGLKKLLAECLEDVDSLHVKVQPGNTKTGKACWTVSLLPVIDCTNCSLCKFWCYDMAHDMIFATVRRDRARNSAIHKHDIARFWREVEEEIKENGICQLRINVGGDLTKADFPYIKDMAINSPRTHILFFTKSYSDINEFLDGDSFPENVHPIISRWIGMSCENKHNLPESHVLFKDGTTTAPKYGAVYCGGNCSRCFMDGEGCWTLKRGESVIFNVH